MHESRAELRRRELALNLIALDSASSTPPSNCPPLKDCRTKAVFPSRREIHTTSTPQDSHLPVAMAAKPSMDEEQAMLPNMHDNTESIVDSSKAEKDSHQFVAPGKILSGPACFTFDLPDWFSAFTLRSIPFVTKRKLENFVIKYTEGQECATTSETLTITDLSQLGRLFIKAYMSSSELHAVVNWNGNPLAIMPREDAEGVFTTFVNRNEHTAGHIKFLMTGDVISCCKLAQPFREVDFDSILGKCTSFRNDSDGAEEEKLTNQRRFSVKSILDVLATMMKAVVAVTIFAVRVLVAFVLCLLAIPMLDSITGRNISRLLE